MVKAIYFYLTAANFFVQSVNAACCATVIIARVLSARSVEKLHGSIFRVISAVMTDAEGSTACCLTFWLPTNIIRKR